MIKYRAFIEVVETGSITKAAKKLGYSQPGISYMIDSLEKEIGFPLLIRGKYNVQLTKDGARILYTWQFALTAVLIEGVIFILLTITNVREAIVNAIPTTLKNAIGVGIGLYIAFIGLRNAGFIVNSDATSVALGDFSSKGVILFLIGVLITAVLVILKVRGGMLIGIIATTLIGIPMGVTNLNGVVSTPPSINPIFCQFEWSQIFTLDMLIVVFTFLFIDMFDTISTVIGVSVKSGMVNKDGKVDGINKILMADAVATQIGRASCRERV